MIDMKEYQRRLLKAGHNPGPLDGDFGKKTLKAYIAMKEKGRVDLPVYLMQAFKDLGVKEKKGNEDHPRIIQFHDTTTLDASHDEVPWCSSAMNCWMKEGGHNYTRSAMARSWLSFGSQVVHPLPGDIIVFERGAPPSGHVAFFLDWNPDEQWVLHLGGNQSDAVTVAISSTNKILGIRRP